MAKWIRVAGGYVNMSIALEVRPNADGTGSYMLVTQTGREHRLPVEVSKDVRDWLESQCGGPGPLTPEAE